MKSFPTLLALLGLPAFGLPSLHAGLSAADYPSIQEAIDKNPGKMIEVPAGDHLISAAIRVTSNGSGLYGPGRIIQENPRAAIIEVQGASGVQLRDLTLTRPPEKMETSANAVSANDCEDLELSNLQVLDNRTDSAALAVQDCRRSRIRNCVIQNYSRIAVDDRTDSADWGFAFSVINGTGMEIRNSQGTLIEANQIVESKMLPTPEIKAKHGLGKFVKKNAQKGILTKQTMWDEEYYNAWHQGSALIITGPESNDYTRVLGNYIEHAAQGIDIHADHVIVANNIVNDSFIGMKAMHGSRNVIITGNQFSKSALWSIGLMPGAGSHAAGDNPGQSSGANIDGHSIIANNIISDFGYGDSAWMWKDADRFPIRLDEGQKPQNPRLTSVVVQGNIVYDPGTDQVLVDGKPQVEPPRYKYAVYVNESPEGPLDLRFSGNIFQPGTDGVSNIELKP